MKLDESLVSDAAALGSEDMGEMPEPDESEDGGKADFLRMCKAIRAGKDAEAWEAYRACAGMDMGDEPATEPLDDMG